jgi:glutathione synthase/RimK-type ligase-like ATP-grasp enzyme
LFTGLVSAETLANLDLIRITPGIFQERIDKSYELRITVIGSRIFAVKIDSQALAETQLDWRHAQHDVAYEVATLPNEITMKINAFMQSLGLVYGAFDFIVTPDGRYVFLEVNPGGAYMWVEAATGLAITPALADALIAPCRS